jgi:hypothetical protein
MKVFYIIVLLGFMQPSRLVSSGFLFQYFNISFA